MTSDKIRTLAPPRPATPRNTGDIGTVRRANPLLLVMQREMRTRGLSAGYLVSSATFLLLLVGLIVVPTLLSGPTTYPVGLVGDEGRGILDAAAETANRGAPTDERTSFDVTALRDEAAARRAVEDDAVDAVLVGEDRVIVSRASGFGGNDLLELLQRAAGDQQVERLVGAEDLPTCAPR